MTSEPRTVRQARLATREAEVAIERIHMAPAASLALHAAGYLRKARLALRQAERALAKADDPREKPLEALRAQIQDRRPLLRQRRRRYRCPACFYELLDDSQLAEHRGLHRRCGVAWEPVARRVKR